MDGESQKRGQQIKLLVSSAQNASLAELCILAALVDVKGHLPFILGHKGYHSYHPHVLPLQSAPLARSGLRAAGIVSAAHRSQNSSLSRAKSADWLTGTLSTASTAVLVHS